jgi:hypothetical protein
VHDDLRAKQTWTTRLVAAVGDELRHRPSGVRDDDLFAGPNAAKQVAEEIARVTRVVLGQRLAWRGVATRPCLATPPSKRAKHCHPQSFAERLARL